MDHVDALTAHDDRAAVASVLDDLALQSHDQAVVLAVARPRSVEDLLRAPSPPSLLVRSTPSSTPTSSESSYAKEVLHMFALERATTPRRAGVWTIIGLLLVPLVVAGGFLWAGWNSSDRLDRVQAAVVNADDPVELNGQTCRSAVSSRAVWSRPRTTPTSAG